MALRKRRAASEAQLHGPASEREKRSLELPLGILGAIFGLIGTVVGVLSYVQSQKSLDMARASEQVSRRVEVEQYLAEAWDLMGGEVGTTSIQRPTSDDKKLELARRLIVDKALVVLPTSSKAHRYHAVYLYAKGDLVGAIHELDTALKLDPTSAEAQFGLARLNIELLRVGPVH